MKNNPNCDLTTAVGISAFLLAVENHRKSGETRAQAEVIEVQQFQLENALATIRRQQTEAATKDRIIQANDWEIFIQAGTIDNLNAKVTERDRENVALKAKIADLEQANKHGRN